MLAEFVEDEEAAQAERVAVFIVGLIPPGARPMPMNATATSPSSPARL